MKEYIERSEAIRALRTDVMGGLNYERILSNIPASPVRPARPGVWVDTDPEKPDWSKEKILHVILLLDLRPQGWKIPAFII